MTEAPTILTCPVCETWQIDDMDGSLQDVANLLTRHIGYCLQSSERHQLVMSAKVILRDAAGKVLAFDPDLARDLSDMASDYAGPWKDEK